MHECTRETADRHQLCEHVVLGREEHRVEVLAVLVAKQRLDEPIQVVRSRSLGGVPVVFEVEAPQTTPGDGEAAARIRLFRSRGARVITGLNYVAPNMDTMDAGDEAPYQLMYARPGVMPAALGRKEVTRILNQLYNVWYLNWFSNRPNAAEHGAYLQHLHTTVASTVEDKCPLL